jgi:HAD superfamily hydrolase (TIGR01549 family)
MLRSAVTFDLWHTLLHLPPREEDEYMRRQFDAATRVLEGSGPLPGAPVRTSAQLRTAFEREYAAAVIGAVEGRSVSPEEQLSRAARASGRVARPEAYVAEIERTLQAMPFEIAPHAVETMSELSRAGYAIGIISNTVGEPGRLLRPILRSYGFDQYVEAYTFSNEQPWTKPAPEIFQSALTKLGSKPSVAVHVGDGWADMEGARRAGYRAWVLYAGLQHYSETYRRMFEPAAAGGPDLGLRVETMPEVVPLVRRLLPLGPAGEPQ